jgi:TRAP-type C4-dicarboxylate transport system permease large subunit
VATAFAALPVDRYVIVIAILIMYFIMGFFLDMLSMVVVTTPIFFPLVVSLGFDPIWYGVMIVVAMEQGQLTPPFGINLFIVQGIAKDIPLQNIIRHIWPFIYAIFIFMFLMVAFPELALFLPHLMK